MNSSSSDESLHCGELGEEFEPFNIDQTAQVESFVLVKFVIFNFFNLVLATLDGKFSINNLILHFMLFYINSFYVNMLYFLVHTWMNGRNKSEVNKAMYFFTEVETSLVQAMFQK